MENFNVIQKIGVLILANGFVGVVLFFVSHKFDKMKKYVVPLLLIIFLTSVSLFSWFSEDYMEFVKELTEKLNQ